MCRKRVGLIPAAGYTSRIAPIPCSKEIYPIGFHCLKTVETPRPKVISSYLMESFGQTGADHNYIIIRDGKWNIPEYFGQHKSLGLNDKTY
ncbi:MAG: hypothetical protein U5K69_18720 [Balneolaceae bacterium]|nr:hypothetical protein [Balneolaceae bacterium]